MSVLRRTMILGAALAATASPVSPAWAIAGGGFAPGGPMSGSMRPACNGYNMDGTVNNSPGANQPGCVDHSARGLHRPAPTDRPVYP